MRRRISIRGRVRPSVRLSVRPSVGPSVRMSHVIFEGEITHTRRILCRVSGLVFSPLPLFILDFPHLRVGFSTFP